MLIFTNQYHKLYQMIYSLIFKHRVAQKYEELFETDNKERSDQDKQVSQTRFY